jgi:hypothetical protein
MSELTVFDLWCASYVLAVGCKLIKVLSEPQSMYVNYVFDDANGQATRALNEWRSGTSFIRTKSFIQAYKAIRQISRRTTAQVMKEEVHGLGTTSN